MTLTETHQLVGSTRTMVTSYYDDPRFDRYNTRQLTSSGEKFDASNPGRAASSVFPDGTELLLWNASNGRAAHVRVNDFGPFLGNRTLDITKSLAERLDITRKGVVALRVTVVASPSTNESRYIRFRVYPNVGGYLGVYGEAALVTLARDLMSDSRSADARRSTGVRVANIPLPQPKPLLQAPPTRKGLLTLPLSQIRIVAPQTLRHQPPMENATLLSPPLLRSIETLPTEVVVALASDSDRPAIHRLIHLLNLNALASLIVVSLMGTTIILLQRHRRPITPNHIRPVASPARQAKTSAVSIEGATAVPHITPETRSFIGRELQISGDVVTYNDIVLEGRIDGDCVCRRLTIKVGGMLIGDVVAEEVLVAGSVTGKILAKTVGIDSRAAVSGEINYCDLIVERNRLFDVMCHRISIEAWRKSDNLEPHRGTFVQSVDTDSKSAFRTGVAGLPP